MLWRILPRKNCTAVRGDFHDACMSCVFLRLCERTQMVFSGRDWRKTCTAQGSGQRQLNLVGWLLSAILLLGLISNITTQINLWTRATKLWKVSSTAQLDWNTQRCVPPLHLMFALFGVYLGSMPMRFGVLSFVWVCQLVHLTICQAPDDGPDVFEGEAWVYFGGWFNAVPLIVRRCDIQQALPPDVVVTQPLRVSFLESEMRRHRKKCT